MSTVTVTETLVDPSTAAYAGWSATVRPVGSESDPAAPVYALGSDHTALGEVVCDVNSSGVWSTTLHPVSELTPSGSRYRISYTAPSGVQAPADVYIEPQTSPSTQRVEDILSTAPGALSTIAASSVTFSPTGTVASTNVQAAIAEVASEGGASTVDVVSNVASSRILGRTTAGSGDSEELTAAQTKTLLAVTSTDISDFNSAAVSAGSGTYEALANKDTDGTLAANSDTKYASQKATKTYADLKLAKASNLSDVASAATAFGNIKQAASDSATGVVELATAAETTTGTDATRAVTPDGLAGSEYGIEVIEIMASDMTTSITTGDGKAGFMVPTKLNGWNLIRAHAGLLGAQSSSGLPTVQIRRVRSGTPADMLSTKVSIDANESTSHTAATPPVVDTANDDVATGDLIYVDIDVAGTGAKGLIVALSFQLP